MSRWPSDEERFWARVDKAASPPCWVFQGGRQGKGYGRLKFNGKVEMAHVIAYEIFKGPLPPGLQPDHLCQGPQLREPRTTSKR